MLFAVVVDVNGVGVGVGGGGGGVGDGGVAVAVAVVVVVVVVVILLLTLTHRHSRVRHGIPCFLTLQARAARYSALPCAAPSLMEKSVSARPPRFPPPLIPEKIRNWYLFFFLFLHFYFPASGQAVVTGVVPFSPRFLPSIFIAHRVQQSHCSSIFHRVLLTHALALSASQFVHKRKSQRIYTNMHSAGLELTKLTYTRLEDNLTRHRGDRSYVPTPT